MGDRVPSNISIDPQPHTAVLPLAAPAFPFNSQWAFSLPTNTIRHLSRGIRTQWAGEFTSCLRQCIDSASPESFHKLLCFPKLTLSSLLRGGQKKRKQAANIIRKRLNLWQRGDFVSLQDTLPNLDTFTNGM